MQLIKNWKFYLSTLWIIITLSFAGWWLVNGLNLLKLTTNLAVEEIDRYRFMLISEGITWMFLLILGGGTLIYFVLKEEKKNHETKEFVASFSHDLKTSIASLRLQAESLKEDVKDPDLEVLVNRLVNDSLRLQVQLENSLQFSSNSKIKLLTESLSLSELVKSLSYHWPDIQLKYDGKNENIMADKRAIEIILRNIIYNAKVHGGATSLDIKLVESPTSQSLILSNNGSPFKGDTNKLGELYFRHNPSSGSGLGLYIVGSLMKLMSGQVKFSAQPFTVELMFNKVNA